MTAPSAKERFCWNCGASLGVLPRWQWEHGDTCGDAACEREARDAQRAERDEAHEQLDRDMGW